MKTSLVITVLNEEKYIGELIDSIAIQSKLPNEIIIVDGGSTDTTLSVISNFKFKILNKRVKIKVIVKKGNRSVGRNEGIKKAVGDIILSTDGGCILDKNWLKNITEPFKDPRTDVVAGYYDGFTSSIFQKCLIPYVLIMPDKVNENDFLPASRTMAFKKSVWQNAGGFNEELSHNEDFAFANKLKKIKVKIVFKKNAIVHLIPRKNLREAFIMFFRFAFGDAESGLLRNKVLLIYARYVFYLYLIILMFLLKSLLLLTLLIFSPVLYFIWAINKNYVHVKDVKAFFILPALQMTADLAVLIGTSFGVIKYLLKVDYKSMLKENIAFITLLIIYVATMLLVIRSGIPNQTHPFPYQMDEWHQLQAVRNVFKYGSPNLVGSANGTMFNFFLSGLMLIPFYLVKAINPFLIKSAVDALQEQEKLFTVLRFFTLFFGFLTLIMMSKIAKLLKLNPILVVFLFLFTPAWLVLSNFFKYDISLTFWITLSLYYLVRYSLTPDRKNFLLASFASGMAFAVKVSGIPLLPILVSAFFLFAPNFKKKYSDLILGILAFLLFSIFFGLPDILFGGRNMNDYLFSNVISGPSEMLKNHNLDYSLLNLTFLHKLPAIFGHILYSSTIFSILCVSVSTIIDLMRKNFFKFKLKFFLILSFLLFCLSLVPIGIAISANRAVVLLPFIVILNLLAFKELSTIFKEKKLLKGILFLLFMILFSVQLFESYLWVWLKISNLPEQTSSAWIVRNIPKQSSIGLENIPIYQFEPDYILKEFYDKQYHSNISTTYSYFVIDSNTKNFPKYIILSNVNYELKYLKKSPKKDLIKKMKSDNYTRIAYFPLKLPYYKYFDNYFYYPFLGLFEYPDGISIYEKK